MWTNTVQLGMSWSWGKSCVLPLRESSLQFAQLNPFNCSCWLLGSCCNAPKAIENSVYKSKLLNIYFGVCSCPPVVEHTEFSCTAVVVQFRPQPQRQQRSDWWTEQQHKLWYSHVFVYLLFPKCFTDGRKAWTSRNRSQFGLTGTFCTQRFISLESESTASGKNCGGRGGGHSGTSGVELKTNMSVCESWD